MIHITFACKQNLSGLCSAEVELWTRLQEVVSSSLSSSTRDFEIGQTFKQTLVHVHSALPSQLLTAKLKVGLIYTNCSPTWENRSWVSWVSSAALSWGLRNLRPKSWLTPLQSTALIEIADLDVCNLFP